MPKMKAIMYGIRSPEDAGDFDRRPVVKNPGEEPSYDFGMREKGGKDAYFAGNRYGKNSAFASGGANYAKQKKMQGITGGHGRGKDSFGKPKGSTSSFKGDGPMAKQKKGFGGQTTTQY